MSRLVRFLGLLGFLTIGLCTGAMAQSAAPSAAPPSESHIAAALDLLQANNAAGNVATMLDAMAPLETASIKRSRPQATDAEISAFEQTVRQAILSRQDEMLRIYAVVYAQNFTEDELKSLAAFYRSDIGKKYVATIPALVKETTPLAVAWATKVLGEALQSIQKPASGDKI